MSRFPLILSPNRTIEIISLCFAFALGAFALKSEGAIGLSPVRITRPQPKPLNGDELVHQYFKKRTEALERRTLSLVEARNLEDWEKTQRQLRLQLQDMLGLNPWPERTDLKPEVTGTIEKEDYRVEKIHFQSSPGLYVTANLYVPKGISKPAPTILYVCGHSHQIEGDVSYGNKTGYHHHGVWFARNGYVCLMIDTLQLGEIQGIHHGTYRYGRWDWNARGYTPAGVEAWNSIRAIDYLETRPEVDAKRIGITGRSGGGAYSWWTAALDQRIQVAAPVAGITDLRNHVIDGVVAGHCDCMFMVNTYGWDYPLVAAMVAPRPLLILNSDKDSIFPLDGVVRTHAFLKKIYELHGAENNLGLTITDGPHQDTQQLRIPAFHWFDRFLKQDEQLIEMAAEKTLNRKDLRVFGDQLPEDEINTTIDDSFVPEVDLEVPRGLAEWARLRGSMLSGLKELSFGSWSWGRDLWNAPAPKLVTISGGAGMGVQDDVEFGVEVRVIEMESESGYPLRMIHLSHSEGSKDQNANVCLQIVGGEDWDEALAGLRFGMRDNFSVIQSALGAEEDLPEPDPAVWDELSQQADDLWIAAPRGIGPTAWTENARDRVQIRRRFQLLGETQDGMRVWDVIQVIRAIQETGASINLQASGAMGGLGLVASIVAGDLLDSSTISSFHWQNPVPLFGSVDPVILNRKKALAWNQALALGLESYPITLEVTEAQMEGLRDGVLNWVLKWAEATATPMTRLEIKGTAEK